MNKFVFTGIAGCVLATTAYAQSSVILYGLLDDGLNYNSNSGGGRSFALQSGSLQGSRFGFRVIEDLGGGLQAVSVLENGLDNNTGKLAQGGLEFGRQAYVGLENRYGSIRLGRQYDVGFDYVGPLQAGNQWGGAIAAHPGDLDNVDGTVRTNNGIKFASASFNGLAFGGMLSLGGVAGDVTRNQSWSIGTAYASGPLLLAASYKSVRNPNLSFFGNATSGTPSAATANVNSSVYNGFLSARTYAATTAGGAYTFGAATIGFTYSYTAFSGLGDTSSGPNPSKYSGSVHFQNGELNFKYLVRPTLQLALAYDYTKSSDVAAASGLNRGATYHQGMAGVDYFLSKRTDIYLVGIYQAASGTDSRNLPAVAALNTQTPSSSSRQALVRVGMRHKF